MKSTITVATKNNEETRIALNIKDNIEELLKRKMRVM